MSDQPVLRSPAPVPGAGRSSPSPLEGEGRGEGGLRSVEIPTHILVRCPLKHFAMRALTHCDGCEHFRGLAELLVNPATPFHRRFAARCAFPVDRELAALAED